MSGERTLAACCCSRAAGCPDEAPESDLAGSGEAQLVSNCCTLQHERHGALLSVVRPAPQAELREMLESWSGLVAVFTGLLQLEPGLAAPAPVPVPWDIPAGQFRGTPLYLAHRALLI